MTKKSIALFAAYVLSLVACFTVALFFDAFSVADENGVLVGYTLPCVITEVSCPACSESQTFSPSEALYNIVPTFYPEHVQPDAPWIIGYRRLVGMQMEHCYDMRYCKADGTPHIGWCCDPVDGCFECNDPNSICYDVVEEQIIYSIQLDIKIWKPCSEY